MTLVAIPSGSASQLLSRAAPVLWGEATRVPEDDEGEQIGPLASARALLPLIEKRQALHQAALTRLGERDSAATDGPPLITARTRRLMVAGTGIAAVLSAALALSPLLGPGWALTAGLGLAVHLTYMAARGGRFLRQASSLGPGWAVLRNHALGLAALVQGLLIATLPLALGAPPALTVALGLVVFAAAASAFLGHARDGEGERLERDCARAEIRLRSARDEALAGLARARAGFEAELAVLERKIAPDAISEDGPKDHE